MPLVGYTRNSSFDRIFSLSFQLSIFPKAKFFPLPLPHTSFPSHTTQGIARTDHISNGHQSHFTPETYTLRSRVIYRAV